MGVCTGCMHLRCVHACMRVCVRAVCMRVCMSVLCTGMHVLVRIHICAVPMPARVCEHVCVRMSCVPAFMRVLQAPSDSDTPQLPAPDFMQRTETEEGVTGPQRPPSAPLAQPWPAALPAERCNVRASALRQD